MKRLVLIAVLLVLPSCSLTKMGKGLCDAEKRVSASIDQAALSVAGVFKAGLQLFCMSFDAVVNMPGDAWGSVWNPKPTTPKAAPPEGGSK